LKEGWNSEQLKLRDPVTPQKTSHKKNSKKEARKSPSQKQNPEEFSKTSTLKRPE